MIYYSNSVLHNKHMTFIGRWSPLHKGHIAIMNAKRREHPGLPILVMVRNTKEDTYPPHVRALYIKRWMKKENIRGTIMIIPNVEGVYWGRGVGYNVGMVDVDMEVQKISGTNIRDQMAKATETWKHHVANPDDSYMLTQVLSQIVDRGLVVWLTGCPSSGKTTLAKALLKELSRRYPHLKTQLLDGDDMRTSPLANNVGFSKKDRADHIRRMGYLAGMFADHGVFVVCAFVSPDRRVRNEVRRMIGKDRFIEVHVHADETIRLARDTKGLYKKAKKGEISNLTGFNAPYENPLTPDVFCDTGKTSVVQCTERMLAYITSR